VWWSPIHDLSILKMASQQGLTLSPQRWTTSIRLAENMSLDSIESHINAALSSNVTLFKTQAEKREFIDLCLSELPGPRLAKKRLKKIMSRIKQAKRVMQTSFIERSSFQKMPNSFLYPMNGDGVGEGTKLWWRRWLPHYRQNIKDDKERNKMIRREVRLCLMDMCSKVTTQHKEEIKEHKRILRLQDRERRRHIREDKLIAKILSGMTKKVERMIKREIKEKERANRPKGRRGRRKHGELADRETRVPAEKWPTWLPPGWFATEVPRFNSPKHADMYYYHERSWTRCRSRPEVFRKVAALNLKAMEKVEAGNVPDALMEMMPPPHLMPPMMSQMMMTPGMMNMVMMKHTGDAPKKKRGRKKKKKEETVADIDGEPNKKKKKRSDMSMLENLMMGGNASVEPSVEVDGEKKKELVDEKETEVVDEKKVDEKKNVVVVVVKETTNENKRKKEHKDTTSQSPKKKKAKIEVPIVESNDTEAVQKLTKTCEELTALSKGDVLTQETQGRIEKLCITLNMMTPTINILKATGVGVTVRKLRKREECSKSLRGLAHGIYKRWKKMYFNKGGPN